MKSKKTRNVKNGSAHLGKDSSSNSKNRSQSSNIVSSTSTKVSVGAASVVCLSILIAYKTDVLPNLLPLSDTSLGSTGVQTIGGWRIASEGVQKKYGSTKCTITRRRAKSLTNKEFQKEFRFKKPLLVSFEKGASDWTIPEKWSVDSLKREYGDWLVYSGNSLDIVRRGGNGDVESSFTKFVDQIINSKDDLGEPLYIFDRAFYNDSSLPTTLKPPKYFEIKDGRDDSIFFLGTSSSGVSFHKHADTWNGVIYGEKRWFLYPKTHTPPGGVYPGFTQLEWFEKVYPNLQESDMPMECVQKAGEILYLPEGTYHGTINLGDTVAIGIQRKEASTKEEKIVYEVSKMNRQSMMNNDKLTNDQRNELHTKRVKLYEELYKLLPESSEVMMKLAELYSGAGDNQKGLEFMQMAIDKDPYFVLAYANKANIHDKIGEVEKAEELFKKTIELNPNLWDARAHYGSFLLSHNRPAEAIKHFKKGIELNPKQQMFWSMLKRAQIMLGDTEGPQETERLMHRNDKR